MGRPTNQQLPTCVNLHRLRTIRDTAVQRRGAVCIRICCERARRLAIVLTQKGRNFPAARTCPSTFAFWQWGRYLLRALLWFIDLRPALFFCPSPSMPCAILLPLALACPRRCFCGVRYKPIVASGFAEDDPCVRSRVCRMRASLIYYVAV